jgi:Bardet-Biedl syndrome 7 protein
VWRSSKGEAVFKSDNVSTLTQIKEVISREATQRSVTLSMNLRASALSLSVPLSFSLFLCLALDSPCADLNEASVPYLLSLLHPLLDKQLRLARQATLLDSVQVLPLSLSLSVSLS